MFLKACSNMVGGIIARFRRWRCVRRLGRSGKGTGLSGTVGPQEARKTRQCREQIKEGANGRAGKQRQERFLTFVRNDGLGRAGGPYLAFTLQREYTLISL
jgi:hypothetical protein